ncbi:MAG: LamG domain-containing protein [Microgenomates group bacterium]
MVKKTHSLLQKWYIAGIAVLLVVTAFFIVSRIPKKPELGFSRQLFNPGEFHGTIPNVLDTTISRSEQQVEVVVKRENVSLSFQLPIEGTKIKESENLLAFSSPNGEITTEYSMRRDGLKENIILNKVPKENIFPSTLKTEGLITKISAEGIPVFFDKNNTYQFHFERPYVKDAAGAVSYAVSYRVVGQEEENVKKTQEQFATELLSRLKTIKQIGQSYVLQVVVDPTWLHDPKRVLPITIDPTVVHNTSSTFATGTLDNSYDSGSGASPILGSGYQELAADANTVGLWHMNEASGNVLDSSGNGITGTPTGTTVVAGKMGNGRSFNGTTNYIEFGDVTILDQALQGTISVWIKPNSLPTASDYNSIIAKADFAAAGNAFFIRLGGAEGIRFAVRDAASNQINCDTITFPPVGEWTLVTGVFTNNQCHVYFNDDLKVSSSVTSFTGIQNTTTTLRIGSSNYASELFFDGLIDEVRISNIARSLEDIKASASRRPNATYTSPVIDLGTKATAWSGLSWVETGVATGFGETPYSSTGLIAQWNLNERGTAIAANYAGTCGTSCNATLTGFSNTNGPDLVLGSGWTAQNQRWGAGAIMFNGTSDYLSVPNHSSLNVTGGPFTIESWVKPRNLTARYTVFSTRTTNAAGGWQLEVGTGNGGTGRVSVTGLNTWIFDSVDKVIEAEQWSHIVYTRASNSDTGKVYVNGKEVRSITTAAYTIANNTDVKLIGAGTLITSFFPGVIDSTRFYGRVLDANEILSNYNATNVEFQTRVGNTADPTDGTWEAWKPITNEATVDSFDSSPLPSCTANGGVTTDGGKTYMFTTGDRAVYLGTEVDQKYTVPEGVTSVTVKMWGGGGGGGAVGGWTYGYAGGGGGYTTGTIAVTPGQVLDVMVGAGGAPGYLNYESSTNSYGGGGRNCNSDCRYSGQGGGRSAIRYGGVDLLTAGGGGGGGSTLTTSSSSAGGAGGGTSGAAGSAAASPAAAGGGGTQVAGGAGGNGNLTVGYPGTQYTGGNVLGGSYGGGGGGGWYGGGSGSYHNVTISQMGGGGGGSGYIGGAGVSAASTTAGSGATPGNSGDVDFMGRGWGGTANSTVSGYAGAVIITPNRSMTFTCTTSGNIDVLVVAGGGGGGANMGGGGGGGGVVYKEKYPVVANTPISVSVGYGGAGAPAGIGVHPPGRGTNGGNSTFGTITAVGGGWGGTSHNTQGLGIHFGNSGGSGGGSSGYNNDAVAAGTYGSGAGTVGQGYRGGLQGGQYYSGGGGGAGGPGADGNNQANGGPGLYNDILGVGYYWGGGGGGAGYSVTGGNGGVGGGGGGGTGVTNGGSGLNPGSGGSGGVVATQTNMAGGNGGANTGGGGGGSSHYNFSNPGGNGGSGIVIVRVSKNTSDTTTKIEGSASQKLTTGKAPTDTNTVGIWHLDETGGTGAYIKNDAPYNIATYNPTGADQTYTVPAGVTSVNVKMWGGGGGGGAPGGWTYGYAGGGGGYTSGTIAVTPGQVLTVMVGAGGVSGVLGNESATESYGGGGRNCVTSDCRYAGQGGGRSAIRYGGVDLLTAGGGGGGGATSATSSDSSGGAGGGVYGQRGWAANNFLTSGGGGWQGGGGIAGVGAAAGATAGTQYTGGHAATGSYGGGGGGGWYGGGGGAYDNVGVAQMGGGGGGSGYISGDGVTNGYTLTGRDTRQAGSNDPANGGAGAGGVASTNGVGGRVVITAVNGSTDHGTPTGTTVVKGISGKARSFNGSSDKIVIPNNSTFDFRTGNFTIQLWVKPTTIAGNYEGLLSTYNGSVGFWLATSYGTNGHIAWWNPTNGWIDSGVSLDTNVWQHLAVSRLNGTVNIYKNGKVISSTAGWTGDISSTASLTVGLGYTGYAYYGGAIDEIRIQKTARTSEEIAEDYRAGRDTYSEIAISLADLSNKTILPFYVAADRPGTYLSVAMGESSFVNNQADINTLAFWHLDEQAGSGAYVKDGADIHHGTPVGTTSVLGKVGSARSFTGTDNISLGNQSIVDNLANVTVDAWVYPTVETAATHFRLFSENAVLYVGHYGGNVSFYMGNGAAWVNSTVSGPLLPLNQWSYVSWVKSGTDAYIYVNGQQVLSMAAPATLGTSSVGNYLSTSDGTTQPWTGSMDEVRISNVARTADEIRQAYEVGLRSHSITIDFGAKLDAGNLIANSGDLSFTVDATSYGLNQKGSNIYPEDKIIVRENYDGTEYTAQGTVTSVNPSTGALTVLSWDAGGTFPAGGFTANADVFKWQKEYWNITASQSIHRNATDLLTLRFTDGNEARTVWIDDLKSNGNYLTNAAGSSIASSLGDRYFQYRTIFHSSDEAVSANLTSVTLNYNANVAPALPTLDSPVNAATAVSRTPTLQTTTTDINIDYLRYKIELCTNLAMTTGCQTFDQTSSQTGWSGQNTETNTAYVSGMQASYTISTPLNYNSTYYWRSYAIDPNGTNVWTSTQAAPFSFTTLTVEAASSCKMTRTNNTTNTIEWVDVSANETGYRIQRNLNNAGWVDLDASLNPNTVSYIDNTVQLNNSYQYRIASFIAGPQYSTWCTTQTQSINEGLLQFGGGFSFSGITIQ